MEQPKKDKEPAKVKLVDLEEVKTVMGGAGGPAADDAGIQTDAMAKPTRMCAW
jgi:hypothetical protein